MFPFMASNSNKAWHGIGLRHAALAVITLTACGSAPVPEQPSKAAAPIVGGQLETGFPAVGNVSGNGFLCTATLISPSLVLTAKHCGNPTVFNTGTNPGDYVPHQINSNGIFKWFPQDSSNFIHDAQLLQLTQPITSIRPMDLEFGARPSVGSTATAVGFGDSVMGNNSTAGTKRSGQVVIAAYGPGTGTGQPQDGIELQCGTPPAACNNPAMTAFPEKGDSGGPLIANGRIIGVFSGWVPNVASGWYQNLATALTWIAITSADYSSEPLVSAVSWGPSRLDAFVRGTNTDFYHRYFDGSNWGPSSGWEDIGGTFSGTPEAVSWGPNRLDIFARGDADRHMYHKFFDNGWGPDPNNPSVWDYLGAPFGGVVFFAHPSAVSWAAERLDIFAVGSDQVLYHKFWDVSITGSDGTNWGPSMTTWEPITGGSPAQFLGPVKAVSWAPGRLDVFAVGTDNALWHDWFDNSSGWGTWESLGGFVLGNPSVVSWGSGRLDLLVKSGGNTSAAYHKAFDNSFGWYPSLTGWESLAGTFDESMAITTSGSNTLTLLARDTTYYGLAFKSWNPGWYPNQTSWEDITEGPFGSVHPGQGVGVPSFAPQCRAGSCWQVSGYPVSAFGVYNNFGVYWIQESGDLWTSDLPLGGTISY